LKGLAARFFPGLEGDSSFRFFGTNEPEYDRKQTFSILVANM